VYKSNAIKFLAASTAVVALAFSPLAQAEGAPAVNNSATHPLLTAAAGNKCSVELSRALVSVTANNASNDRAGGFISELEKVLKEPAEKSRLVVYPKTNSNELLVLAAVVPPKGFESLPIAVCAQQNGKPLGAWNITAKGEVVSRPVVQNPQGSTKAACNAFIALARAEVDQQISAMPSAPSENGLPN